MDEGSRAARFSCGCRLFGIDIFRRRNKKISKDLQNAPQVIKKAKDTLHALQLSLLPDANIHVKDNVKRVKRGNKLYPILLVRHNHKLLIADGNHRMCAIFYLSE